MERVALIGALIVFLSTIVALLRMLSRSLKSFIRNPRHWGQAPGTPASKSGDGWRRDRRIGLPRL